MTKPTSMRRTGIDIVLTFSRQFLAGLMQLGILLIVARVLGPKGAGAYAVALLLPMTMSQLLNLGLASANVYFVASRKFPLHQAWAASRDLVLVMGPLGLTVGTCVIVVIGDTVFPGVPQIALLLALLIYPTSLLAGIVSGLFQALQDFRAFNIAVLVQPFLSFTGVCLLWFTNNVDIITVLLVIASAHFLSLIAALALLSKHTLLTAPSIAGMEYLRPAIRYGVKAHLGNILSFLNYRLDMLLVNLIAGPAAAGIYSVAVRLTEQLWMISQAVSTVIFPRLSAMEKDENARRTFTPLMARIVLWVTLTAAALLGIIAQPLIQFLFGSDFGSAFGALIILLPGITLFSLGRVIANDFAARGWVGINLALAGLVLLVNTLANLVLIPAYGFTGAAFATTLSYTLSVVVRLTLQKRLVNISWQECFVPTRNDLAMLLRVFVKVKT
ncbi:oligosaccharide flippase family protein [Yoonia sp. F2084L]|uniref:oligosaccharide flippase family protein n=1 Tax=Yoonia sp. F2084L TaxID=2926419 RepID=UPI001FF57C5E|nr:oligosaccharide flippase family protein [Yoonia sp. F2084L]MCK0097481.1 oligosaccharide flippase family protein [Yoonia sp. F2084L]